MKRIGIIILSLLMTVSLVSCIYTQEDLDEAKQSGYDEGYKIGHDEGYETGHDKGYEEGYSTAEDEYLYNDTTSYGQSFEDGITDSSVFVTLTGRKYHKPYCQYIQGKSNLSYYDNAYEAEAVGYTPCSFCY